jgi:OmpA-OmpF porin, OOP family
MNLRTSLVTIFLVPSLTLAQVDEWNTFPSVLTGGQQTKPQPQPDDKSTPAAVDQTLARAEPTAPGADGRTLARAEQTAPAAVDQTIARPEQGAPAVVGQTVVRAEPTAQVRLAASEPTVTVPRQPRFESMAEPHSASTVGHAWNAPGNRRITPGLVGANGLVHTSSAALGPQGIIRLGATGEYFTREDFPVPSATNVRTAGTFAVSYVATPWLETYAAYGASANTNTDSSPTLLQALGDVTLGAKLSRPWSPGLYAGFDLRLQSFSGVGNQDVRNYAWGFGPRLVATYDVRATQPRIPLLLHLNAGLQFDTTGGLVTSHTLNVVEEFAFGVNRYDRFIAGAALEAPIPLVTPYLEYAVGVPLGVPGGQVQVPGGGFVPVADAMPQTIGGGVRITAVRDLTLTVGADFGLARVVASGIAATPPWNLFVGAAFNVDPLRGEGRYESQRNRQPTMARIEGVVLDAGTLQPIQGAVVEIVDTNTPPVASDAERGRFLTHETAPGRVTIRAVKPGYRFAAQQVTLRPGQTSNVQLALHPLSKSAPHFMVTVTGAGKKKLPVMVEVRLKGPMAQSVRLAPQSTEPSRIDATPGKYQINVLAPEYLAQTREVQLPDSGAVKLAFELQPEPKPRLLVVRDGRFAIFEQVQFADAGAKIVPSSYPLLNQVVDAMVRNNIKRVRIAGHTDNRGGKQSNQKLSEDRARAVADYLVKQGIAAGRIESVGYGDTRPLAPNLTARGREMNRRVEFVILEQ